MKKFINIPAFVLILVIVLQPAIGSALTAPNLPNIPTGPVVPVSVPSLEAKETGIKIPFLGVSIPISWDEVAINIAKIAIERIVDSTVVWINNGFEGGPAYVTDPLAYFTDIADGVAGDFIEGSELGFLCSPFQNSIRTSLAINYGLSRGGSGSYYPRCTITGIRGNIEDFYQDFTKGGWDSWFSMIQNDSNNPYGAYLVASAELDSRIASRLGIEDKKLSWNSGFMDFGPCMKTHSETGRCIERGPTVTPGKLIEGQLQSVLGTNLKQLELADEFDELIGALGGALLNKTIFSSKGIFSDAGNYYTTSGGVAGGSDNRAELSCYPSKQSATVGDEVTWSASLSTPVGNRASFTWSGEEIEGLTGQNVKITYRTAGVGKTARVTAILDEVLDPEGNTISEPRTMSAACNNTVSVSKYPPLVAECRPSVYTAQRWETVSWIITLSGGSISEGRGIASLDWNGSTDPTVPPQNEFTGWVSDAWTKFPPITSTLGSGTSTTLVINQRRYYQEGGQQTAQVDIFDWDPTVQPKIDLRCSDGIFIRD